MFNLKKNLFQKLGEEKSITLVYGMGKWFFANMPGVCQNGIFMC